VELLNLSAPHGTAWELCCVAIVIVVAPLVVERLRIPGMIGLLAGGWLLGPSMLGVVSDHGGILKSLGQVGLLYLMFMAGLELDLGLFARLRRQAIVFALATFAAPMLLGLVAGLVVGYEPSAAVLLGSIFASHTLVAYPIVRRMGLGSNRAVATAVGATVLTDTLALVVLAGVSGSATGDASGGELAAQIVLGLAIVGVTTFVVLPRLARWFFTGIGRTRTLRYTFVLAALLGSAVVSEAVGIEAIVGAFFAGLALNRLVPNEGGFMERIEFFGSALLVPCFLVSVGTIIDVGVMADPGTLGLAGLFTLACIGGKFLAAAATNPLFRFSRDEVGVVFGLSVAQAAATLAATFVGLEIGLLDLTAVNAVMIVIVVSLVLASLSAQTFGARLPEPMPEGHRLGHSVVLHLGGAGDGALTTGPSGGAPTDAATDALVRVAARFAHSDGGVVHPVVVVAEGGEAPSARTVEALEEHVAGHGLDVEVDVRHDTTLAEGLVHTAASRGASVIVAPAAGDAGGGRAGMLAPWVHALVARSNTPLVLVRPGAAAAAETSGRVVFALGRAQTRRPDPATALGALAARALAANGAVTTVVERNPTPEVRAVLPGGDGTVVVAQPTTWVGAEGHAGDTVVVAIARGGLLGAARIARAAAAVGATVVAVVDRSSLDDVESGAGGAAHGALRSAAVVD
jgi:Kef-type K+ transport system membrane component KefB